MAVRGVPEEGCICRCVDGGCDEIDATGLWGIAMGQFAERVHTDPDEIARLEALVVELDDEAKVELQLDDGSACVGVVAARPTIQNFRDVDGREGVNGVLRLDDPLEPERVRTLWLDTVRRVRRLGSA